VTARLGEATDTGDADGKIVETAAVPDLTHEDWERIFLQFTGEIEQVPPMYSALKKDGKRLYELARQGQIIGREPRRIRIYEIQMLEAHGNRLVFRVRCSKGTYVRTLIEDMAKAAGTVAHTAALHRETVGDFHAEDMLDLPSAEKLAEAGPDALREHLMPADQALQQWPERRIGSDAARRFNDGQSIIVGAADTGAAGNVRVYEGTNGFLGVGELTGDGLLTPRRIFRTGS
jgi:tRNA pseudouridine55 synthase